MNYTQQSQKEKLLLNQLGLTYKNLKDKKFICDGEFYEKLRKGLEKEIKNIYERERKNGRKILEFKDEEVISECLFYNTPIFEKEFKNKKFISMKTIIEVFEEFKNFFISRFEAYQKYMIPLLENGIKEEYLNEKKIFTQ